MISEDYFYPTCTNIKLGKTKRKLRQLNGLVVRMSACCAEGRGSNPVWGAQVFQCRLSSAETQQPVDRMQHKARVCLVLSVLC